MKNFGQIRNIFHEILAESLLKKDVSKRNLFKQYFKLIKENKILKAQYLVYNNIENKIEENEQKAYQFIQENIEFLKQFKKKDILEANEKLVKLLNENIDSKNYDFRVSNDGNSVESMYIEFPNAQGKQPSKQFVLKLLQQIKNKYKEGSMYNTFLPKFGVIYRYAYGGAGGWKVLFTNDEKQINRPQFDEPTGKYAKRNTIFTIDSPTNVVPNNPLHENITKLIFTDKTPNNIDTIVESQSQIVDYIKNNKKQIVTENKNEIPNSLLSKLATDRFNEKYSDLSEDDKKVFKTVLEGTEETKKELQENTIKDCIELIDNQLVESDLETKEKLLKAKNKLLNMKGNFINEDYMNNITKLIELKKDLSI